MSNLDFEKYLHTQETSGAELHYMLLSYLGRSQYPAKNVQRFTKHDGSLFLELEYTKAGRIRRATTNLPQDEIHKLSDQIVNNLIENQNPRVAQLVCFSNEWVRGALRYKDLFQILPAGSEFPDATVAVADHPFLFQFKFISSQYFPINHMRRALISNEYIRYLHVLSRSGLATASRNVDFCWCIDFAGETPVTKWLQQGYWMPTGFKHELEEYSPIDSVAPILRVPDRKYYERGFLRYTGDFSLPDSIEESLDKIFNLPQEQRKKFDRACTWLSMGQDIAGVSSSAAYIAMVAALEALLDKKSDICSTCGQPKFAVTKKMKVFLQTFVPGIDRHPKEADQIYKTRSDLAHGLDLLLRDLGHFGMTSPEQTSEMMLQQSTFQIARTAVLNWLFAQ